MGIWHKKVINSKKGTTFFDALSLINNSSKHIRLSSAKVVLGLLKVPNTSTYLFPFKDRSKIYIALDGYVYNKQNLCNQLKLEQDIEIGCVIITLYTKYGYEGLYKIEGAFSLIVVDTQKEITLLYRSFLNGYPLYYVAKNNVLSVSTNPVDLLHRPDVSDNLDMVQVSSWFSLDLSSWSDTVFLDLNEVDHGEIVLISDQGLKRKKRSLEDILIPEKYGSEDEMIKRYRQYLEGSVKNNLLPNYKYGVMLSSGMDSSTLAVLASKELKMHGSDLRAYSWSLPSYTMADETEKIKKLCTFLGLELVLFNAEEYAPFSELDSLFLQPDLPFSNLYALMQSKLYANASKDGVDVLLNGHHGDHVFPSAETIFIDIIKDRRFELFLPTMKSVISQTGFSNAWEKSPAIRKFIKHYLAFSYTKKKVFYPQEWLSSEAKEIRRKVWDDEKQILEPGFEQFSTVLEKRNTSSGQGRYVTGQYGIEVLMPYHDLKLLNYTLRFPTYMVYRNGQTKYFAREAMRGLLPESIRTQSRVGLLNKFAHDSFKKYNQNIRERLFDERDPWKVYVDEKWMEGRFKKDVVVKDKELLLIWMALHMAPWQKAIKPGGSLYEATFMQDGVQR